MSDPASVSAGGGAPDPAAPADRADQAAPAGEERASNGRRQHRRPQADGARSGDANARIAEAKARWEREAVEPALARFPEPAGAGETLSGLALDRVYTPADVAGVAEIERPSFPGEYPYTRGVQPTMYRGRLWTMRQYAGYASAEESNRRYRYLLEQGQTGLSVAFDLPTQIGYDADAPEAAGEVGKVGVSICSIEDMAQLFDGIPLDRVSTSMTINATASTLLALYVAVARRQGVPPAKVSGTVQNDILKEYIARGTYIYPPGPSMRLVTDIVEYCARELPLWNSISISGYHMREAGATAIQEVAFTLANGIAYTEAVLARGLDVDRFAPRLAFFFACHNDFLEEIAKFRAARRLWARIMRERFGAKDPRSQMLRFHTQTAGVSLTAQQPENNIVRVAIQALAAVLGGTQSLHTDSMDEALALPTEKSARIALRTQQIIARESGVANTVDPVGGAYAIEELTDRIERAAEGYIRRIDAMGGALRAVELGFFQQEIQDSAYRHQREVESGERVIVGVNRYRTEEAPVGEILRVDPAIGERQRRRLAELRARRDGGLVSERLAALRSAAEGSDNLLPPILDAVEASCTLGEIADTLREVFGLHHENVVI